MDRDSYWGQANINEVFWGQCAAQNDFDWGISQFKSFSGVTNISGKTR